MSFRCDNNLNMNPYMRCNTTFRAQISPAQNIENSIDKLAQKVDEERKKKHNKTAMAVGGSVIGLSLLVAAFNPRVSSRLIEKLKVLHTKNITKLEQSDKNSVEGKLYEATSKTLNWLGRFVSWIGNVNSVKDTYFKKLCTEEKSFFGIHNLERREHFKHFDRGLRRVLKKPHEIITKWGDSLAKHTVRSSYKRSSKKMDSLETLIKSYSEKLSPEKKSEILSKLDNINTKREFFSKENLDQRFLAQENLMGDLNTNIRRKFRDYSHGFLDKNINTTEHFNQNLSFWAQDMMRPERERLEKEGVKVIDELVGNKEGLKGDYREIINLLSENITAEEKAVLEKSLAKTEKSLRKSGKCEFSEYFDKKRDLTLGSAPTDVVTAILGLTCGGVALAAADNKDDRISSLLKRILPITAGIGTTIALTAMLFSGVKGMFVGYGAGFILSLIGSRVDKHRLILKAKLNGEDPKEVIKNLEEDDNV